MPAPSRSDRRPAGAHRAFVGGLTRAFGGAIVFALPLLLTMEMWWLGFTADPARLALFLVVLFPLLVALSYRIGFEPTVALVDDVVDALVAIAVAAVTAAAFLAGLGVVDDATPWDEVVGKIAVQVVPASIGALLAESLLGSQGSPGQQGSPDQQGSPGQQGSQGSQPAERRGDTYAGELFLMCVGALLLALPVAPTEEIVLIAYRLHPWHAVVLVVVSLALMHAFVYGGVFRGTPDVPEGTPAWSLFLRYTVAGYAIALSVSAFVLWTFQRLDGTALAGNLSAIVVLSVPGSIGAAAARLLV